MNITDVQFESLQAEDATNTGMTMRISIFGTGLSPVDRPMAAAVGNEPVRFITPLMSDAGITGLLENTPANDAPVLIGYADGPLVETGHKFQPGIV